MSKRFLREHSPDSNPNWFVEGSQTGNFRQRVPVEAKLDAFLVLVHDKRICKVLRKDAEEVDPEHLVIDLLIDRLEAGPTKLEAVAEHVSSLTGLTADEAIDRLVAVVQSVATTIGRLYDNIGEDEVRESVGRFKGTGKGDVTT